MRIIVVIYINNYYICKKIKAFKHREYDLL